MSERKLERARRVLSADSAWLVTTRFIMKAKRIDKDGIIKAALGTIGIKADEVTVERILNVTDYVRENPDATLKDVLRKEQCALALFEQDDLSKKEKE